MQSFLWVLSKDLICIPICVVQMFYDKYVLVQGWEYKLRHKDEFCQQILKDTVLELTLQLSSLSGL